MHCCLDSEEKPIPDLDGFIYTNLYIQIYTYYIMIDIVFEDDIIF